MGQTTPQYPAKGHAGTVDAAFNRNFFLDAGGQPTFENHVVAQGQVLVPGTVMGYVTATNQLVASDPTAADGSQVPHSVLMESLDTSATGLNAATEVGVLVSSNRMININALVFNANWTLNTLRRAMKSEGFTALRNPIYSAL